MKIPKKLNKKMAIAGIVVLALVCGGATWAIVANTLSENSSETSNVSNSSTALGSSNVSASTISASASEADIDWSALPSKEVALKSGETFTATDAGTYILTGSTDSGVVVKSDGNVRLILNGVTISNKNGVAIYVENANNVVLNLADGSTNTVLDASTRADATLDGAIFSHDDLVISGGGSLVVNSNYADGIVSKDDLKILSGNITVNSADDGIRGKDSVYISGGKITIKAVADGIKSTEDTDASKGYAYISGGEITINAGDDGIKAASSLIIDGGTINIENSVEGFEGTNITINGGKINIYASDDGVNASSDGVGGEVYLKITGGELTVKVGSGDTDGIDVNGNISISGGTVNTTSFDYDGTASLTGGEVYVNGSKVTTIPNAMMGGGGMRR